MNAVAISHSIHNPKPRAMTPVTLTISASLFVIAQGASRLNIAAGCARWFRGKKDIEIFARQQMCGRFQFGRSLHDGVFVFRPPPWEGNSWSRISGFH
mmetsp:Transcript_5143/g.7237  ORF Transcript_5143/g.7237 Transcript_5143/m.7237 type:complete len:98 (+) Transcript_5143:879-1172(+)